YDLQKGECSKHEDQSDCVRNNRRPGAGDLLDDGPDNRRERNFSQITEREAGDCQSDLNARHHAAQIAEKLFDYFGARVAFLDKFTNAREAYRDKRKFRSGEKCVYAHQEEHTEEMEGCHRTAIQPRWRFAPWDWPDADGNTRCNWVASGTVARASIYGDSIRVRTAKGRMALADVR